LRVVSRFVWKSVKRVFRLVYRTLLVSSRGRRDSGADERRLQVEPQKTRKTAAA
jgi:hypothetical protein